MFKIKMKTKMKKFMKLKLLILFLFIGLSSFSQSKKIQFLEWIEVTTTQRDAWTVKPNTHPQIYNITTNQYEYWDGDSWEPIGVGGSVNTLQQVLNAGNTATGGLSLIQIDLTNNSFISDISDGTTTGNLSISPITANINNNFGNTSGKFSVDSGLVTIRQVGINGVTDINFNLPSTSSAINFPAPTVGGFYNLATSITDGTNKADSNTEGVIDISSLISNVVTSNNVSGSTHTVTQTEMEDLTLLAVPTTESSYTFTIPDTLPFSTTALEHFRFYPKGNSGTMTVIVPDGASGQEQFLFDMADGLQTLYRDPSDNKFYSFSKDAVATVYVPPSTFVTLSGSITNTTNELNSYGTVSDSEWVNNGATRGISTTVVDNGTYSLSATGDRYTTVNIRPVVSYFTTGERYRFTFRVNSPEVTSYVSITAGFINFANGNNGTGKVQVGTANTWTTIVIEGEFNGSLPLINFAPRDNTGAVITAFLDSLTIEQI